MLQLLFLFTFPLLVSIGATYVTSNTLSGPWKFFISCTTALYLLYVASFDFLAPQSVGFMVAVAEPGMTAKDEPLFAYLQPYYKPLALFAVASIPILVLLLKVFKRRIDTKRN